MELIHLLDYFQTSEATDDYTRKLKKRVEILREDAEWRQVYMTWEMKLDERYEAGLQTGLREGRESGLQEGRRAELSRQIQKKLQKGKSIAQIADECEETEEVIREIYDSISKQARSDPAHFSGE